jgi:hypothetical protein
MAIDLDRFRVPRRIYLNFLGKIINEWFLTWTAREMAKREMTSRRAEKESGRLKPKEIRNFKIHRIE